MHKFYIVKAYVCVCVFMCAQCVCGGERERFTLLMKAELVEVSGLLGFDSMLLSKTVCP
jgi:hypothetical protein